MGEKEKNNSFIVQAGILAAAGILCRIIGILYRSPLTAIIGDEGNGYYSAAYNIYAIILLVSSYWCISQSTSGGKKFIESLVFVFIKLPLPVLTRC